MGNNENMTVIIKFPRFFAWRKVIVWCSVNLFFTEKAVNFHKIFNQTGVGGSDSAACKNEIYQFLQMLLTILSINYCYFSVKLTTV